MPVDDDDNELTEQKIPLGGLSKAYKEIDDALNIRSGSEKTVWDTSYNLKSQFAPFNPDPLWQRDGDYTTYEEMLDERNFCRIHKSI